VGEAQQRPAHPAVVFGSRSSLKRNFAIGQSESVDDSTQSGGDSSEAADDPTRAGRDSTDGSDDLTRTARDSTDPAYGMS
jgi:hypothetical protein